MALTVAGNLISCSSNDEPATSPDQQELEKFQFTTIEDTTLYVTADKPLKEQLQTMLPKGKIALYGQWFYKVRLPKHLVIKGKLSTNDFYGLMDFFDYNEWNFNNGDYDLWTNMAVSSGKASSWPGPMDVDLSSAEMAVNDTVLDTAWTYPLPYNREPNDKYYYGWVGVKDIRLPQGITEIKNYYFAKETTNYKPDQVYNVFPFGSIKSITFPTTLKEIKECAFKGQGLENITFPENVETIDRYAFSYCINLKNISFSNNSKLKTIGEGSFQNCDSLTDVKLPTGISEIGEYAFKGCKSLPSITLPANIKSIGSAAFEDCEKLTEIHFKSSNPPRMDSYIFPKNRYGEFISTCYVPRGSKEAYGKALSSNNGQQKINIVEE